MRYHEIASNTKVAMPNTNRPLSERELDQFTNKLPRVVQSACRRFLQPKRRWINILLGALFIVAGLFGFLPVLGYWMIPVGMIVLSREVPFLRRPTRQFLGWLNKQYGKLHQRFKSPGS